MSSFLRHPLDTRFDTWLMILLICTNFIVSLRNGGKLSAARKPTVPGKYNGALINYVVTLINPAQHDYNNNERFKEIRENPL